MSRILEQVAKFPTSMKLKAVYRVFDAEDLFGNIVGNPDDIIENPNETKDYKNTIDYKKTPQKVIAGFV